MNKEHAEILGTLIMMSETAGLERACFADIPIQVYHHPRCPGISSTTIKTVLKKSWAHVGIKDAEKEAFRFGSAFHCFNQEPELFRETYAVCPFSSKRGDDWKQYQLRQQGKIILMQNDFSCIQTMSKKLWEHPDASKLMTGAQFEMTYFVRDQRTGVLKKCRVDAIKRDARVISDLKTTWDASPDSFSYDCRKFLYRISAAYYLQCVSEFYGELFCDFNLIPCEKENPFEITVYPVGPESLAKAELEINEALDRIAAVQKDPNAWRGYPLGATTTLFI